MSEQSSNKKEINWPMFVLTVFITAVIVSVIILILTAPRSDFENFGNTAGTTRLDIEKWLGLYNNQNYILKSKTPNVMKLVRDGNKYIPSTKKEYYQYLIFIPTNNSSKRLNFIVPTNITGKDKYYESYHKMPSSALLFYLPNNIYAIPASNDNNDTHYFYIDFKNTVYYDTNVIVPPSSNVKYSPWICVNDRILNILIKYTFVPSGYKFARIERKTINALKASGEKYDIKCPNSKNNLIRVRGVYHKK